MNNIELQLKVQVMAFMHCTVWPGSSQPAWSAQSAFFYSALVVNVNVKRISIFKKKQFYFLNISQTIRILKEIWINDFVTWTIFWYIDIHLQEMQT